MIMKIVLVIVALTVVAASLEAEESHGFQASLTPDIAIYPKTAEIRGLSLNIWGENPQQGVALGFVDGSTGDSSGFTWAIYNYAESYTGVSWGLANYSKTNFTGWQGGILFCPCVVNVSQGTFTGFQEGIVNVAEEFHGLQLGVVNYAEKLHGVQIGLANIAINNGWFDDFPDKLATGFPIVNWSF
jgi:hypothetical protein